MCVTAKDVLAIYHCDNVCLTSTYQLYQVGEYKNLILRQIVSRENPPYRLNDKEGARSHRPQ